MRKIIGLIIIIITTFLILASLLNKDFLPEEKIGNQNKVLEEKKQSIIVLKDGDSFVLTAEMINKKINNQSYVMYGYNGQIPGPILKVQQNSTITIIFKNTINLNTTIHWHGLRQDVKNDGVPEISQNPVAPGQTFVYTLHFPDEGIYWYHPHIREDIQQDNGLYGNMLVDSLHSNYYNYVNQEELLVLDDLLIRDDKIVSYGKNYADHVTMGRFGNVMLLNGKTDYSLHVDNGSVVRFFITNAANVRPFNLSFSGAKMKLVGSDIGLYEHEEYVASTIIAPAERYIIEVLFDHEGEYTIQNINPDNTYDLGTIIVSSQQVEQEYSSDFNNLRINSFIIEDINTFRSYFDKEPDYILDLGINMSMELMQYMDMNDMPCHTMPDGTKMGKCDVEGHKEKIEWEDDMEKMNSVSTSEKVTWEIKERETGKKNMDFIMNAKVGDKLKIRLFNDPDSMHPMQHPIHLHGQRFLVLEKDGVKNDNLVWKDTVLVPQGSTVDILVDVTNPGQWMMHCHIAEHLEAGMMTSLIVGR